MKKKLTILASAIALALPASAAHAIEYHTVYTADGLAVFELRFFDVGDGGFLGDEDENMKSVWNLSPKEKSEIITAVERWVELIKPEPNQLPAIVNIGTTDEVNAFAYAELNAEEGATIVPTQLQALLQGQPVKGDLSYGAHTQMIVGRFDFEPTAVVLAQVPSSKKMSLADTAFHEIGHSLGLRTNITDKKDSEGGDEPLTPHFQDKMSQMDSLLYDDNGKPAQLNQAILCKGCNNPDDPAAFDVRKDQGYLSGKHIAEVLDGSLRGVPVRMLSDSGRVDTNYMSHTELKNSMMSHQGYQNYTTFMEAELALMQDLGYQIDRRNFFGRSIYGSGLNLVNNNGFFKRNAEGTAYVAGEYNTASLGLGLHVYGSNNTITQHADLLAKGDGSAGVRVDGEANTLIIAPTTRIYADGLNGRGVLFAYGKDHNLVQQGEVQALGQDGIAVSFDFGYNQFGYDGDHRGSYIRNYEEKPIKLLDELNGALVNQFDLSGRVAGTKAAIHLSESGLVNQINVMQGAQIEGDIISDYVQKDQNNQLRLTTLNFGQSTDANFQIKYNDNIQGQNIALVAKGGRTALNGQNQVFNVRVAPTATLAGNASYTLNEAETFINEGTVAPGNNDFGRININGNYQQTASGTLLADVGSNGQHDTLAISGNAALDGQLRIEAKPGWYDQNWALLSSDIVQAASLSGDFATINTTLSSPTLSLQSRSIAAGVQRLAIHRQANAYHQYATNSNEHAVGGALYQIAALAQADIQSLYTALDFSNVDGSTVTAALAQLSPSAYSAMAASSLSRERQLSTALITRTTPTHNGTDWNAFALPFGEYSSQKTRDTLVGYKNTNYGLVIGAERGGWTQNMLSLGVYGAVSQQRVTLDSPFNGKGRSTALHIGTQLRFTPNAKAGMYAFAQAQLGWESSKLERQLRFSGYSADANADWNAWSGTMVAGGGYRWAISESLSAGPVAQLSYTTLGRPSLTESGEATALSLSSERFHALRSSIGVSANLEHQITAKKTLKAEFQATWDRELLNKNFVQDASFAGYQSVSFTNRNKIAGRDALGLRAGLSYEIDNHLAIGAGLATSLFQSGYKSVAGNVSVQWRF